MVAVELAGRYRKIGAETGKVSLAVEGELYRNIDEEFLKKKLSEGHLKNVENGKLIDWKRRLQNVKKAKEPSDNQKEKWEKDQMILLFWVLAIIWL